MRGVGAGEWDERVSEVFSHMTMNTFRLFERTNAKTRCRDPGHPKLLLLNKPPSASGPREPNPHALAPQTPRRRADGAWRVGCSQER